MSRRDQPHATGDPYMICRTRLQDKDALHLITEDLSHLFEAVKLSVHKEAYGLEYSLAVWTKKIGRIRLSDGSLCEGRLFDLRVIRYPGMDSSVICMPFVGHTTQHSYGAKRNEPDVHIPIVHLVPLAADVERHLTTMLANAPAKEQEA
jgi:hypothetical protein